MTATLINLFGAPATGKTTASGLVFGHLKKRGKLAYFLQEVATECIIEGRLYELNNQFAMLSKIISKIDAAKDKVDYIILDSPILLGIIYNKDKELDPYFRAVANIYDSRYKNINFLLRQDMKYYRPEGRVHTAEECVVLQKDLESLLTNLKRPYVKTSVDTIVEDLEKELWKDTRYY